MKLHTSTAAWVVTGALGLTALSSAAHAFAQQPESSGLAAVAVAGAPSLTRSDQSAPRPTPH